MKMQRFNAESEKHRRNSQSAENHSQNRQFLILNFKFLIESMSIQSITLTRMTNEVHVQFHESVTALVEQITPEALEIVPLHGLYRKAFDDETEALLIITKSEKTAQIAEQDRVRDSIFRGFSDTVKGFRNHFDPEMREAANRLWNVFLHYGNIARKTLDAQTAATGDMLREFEREDLKRAIEKLQVDGWRSQMDSENRKLHRLMMERYGESAAQSSVRMKTARVETDKFYRAIAAHIDNRALTGANDAAMDRFINELNAIVKRFKNILAQQLGRKTKEG
jgi:hypothetical protein